MERAMNGLNDTMFTPRHADCCGAVVFAKWQACGADTALLITTGTSLVALHD
jgi:hypothetical protein